MGAVTAPPARSNLTVLKRIVNLIPRPIVNSAEGEAGVDLKVRVFTPFSHLVTMPFARTTHAIGLNDVRGSMRHKAAALMRSGVRGPSRNNLSHANRTRKAESVEKVFRRTPGHLQHISPGFATGRQGKGLPRRFRVGIHAVDPTVIRLFAN